MHVSAVEDDAMLKVQALAMIVISAFASAAYPQEAPGSPLYQTIAALDARLFQAYNGCDLHALGSLVADDLEFYHDKTGLERGKGPFLESIRKNVCGKVNRELVRGTLEVHPLHTYGAVEMGTHRFHHPGREESDGVGEAKFVMLWQQRGDVWKLTRVISYDHGAVSK